MGGCGFSGGLLDRRVLLPLGAWLRGACTASLFDLLAIAFFGRAARLACGVQAQGWGPMNRAQHGCGCTSFSGCSSTCSWVGPRAGWGQGLGRRLVAWTLSLAASPSASLQPCGPLPCIYGSVPCPINRLVSESSPAVPPPDSSSQPTSLQSGTKSTTTSASSEDALRHGWTRWGHGGRGTSLEERDGASEDALRHGWTVKCDAGLDEGDGANWSVFASSTLFMSIIG